MPQTVPLYDTVIQGDVRDWRVRLLVTIADGETPPAVTTLDAERALSLAYGQSASGPGQGGPVLPSVLSFSVFDDDGAVLTTLLGYGADQNDAVQVEADSLGDDGAPDLAYAWRGWLQFALPMPPMFPASNPARLELVATDRLGSFDDLAPFVVADLDPPRAFALDEYFDTVLNGRGVDLGRIAYALPLYPATAKAGDTTVEALRLAPALYVAGTPPNVETYLQDAYAGSAGEGEGTLAAQLSEITEALDGRVWQAITRGVTGFNAPEWCVWSAGLMGEVTSGRAAAYAGTNPVQPVTSLGLAPVALADDDALVSATQPISRALTQVVTERSSRVRQYSALTDGGFEYTDGTTLRYWALFDGAAVATSPVDTGSYSLLLPSNGVATPSVSGCYADTPVIRVDKDAFLEFAMVMRAYSDDLEPSQFNDVLVGATLLLVGDNGITYERRGPRGRWAPRAPITDPGAGTMFALDVKLPNGAGTWGTFDGLWSEDNGTPTPASGVIWLRLGTVRTAASGQADVYVDSLQVTPSDARSTLKVGTPGVVATVKRSFVGFGSTPWEVKEADDLWYPVDNWQTEEAAESGTYRDLADLASRRRLARQAALARGIEGTVFGLFPPEQAFTWRGVTYRAARSVSLDLVTEQTSGTWVPKQTSLTADGLPVDPT